ncbi:MAG: ABC transporter permease [Geodermatophilaceae bacterium]|nr:ABC transporter permease [Geodermatophilaceae bacterium]
MHLAALHSRYQFLETIRIPIAVVATTVFPALSLLFFVIPQAELASDPMIASAAAAQLSVFAIMSVCLFNFGVAIAEDRAMSWDSYLRTLPAGPGPRFTGRLLNGLAFAAMGLVPLLVLAAALTEATLPVSRIAAALLACIATGLPFLGLGLAIGHRLSSKASLGVANVLLLPMAFAGGLFLPPELFPHWLEIASRFLPSRAGRDLLVGTVTGEDIPLLAIVVLLAWTGFAVGLAVLAFRRDEGQRFR